jgi:hypothetical protein
MDRAFELKSSGPALVGKPGDLEHAFRLLATPRQGKANCVPVGNADFGRRP